jgi:hypothetical protein
MTDTELRRLRAVERAISTRSDYSVLRDGGEELVRARARELGVTATELMHQWAGESKPPDHSVPGTPGPRRRDHTVDGVPAEPEPSDADDAADDSEQADRECPACDGTGRDDDGGVCERCHGSGRVSDDDDRDDRDDLEDNDQPDAPDRESRITWVNGFPCRVSE